MHFIPHFFAASVFEKIRAWSATTSGTSQTLIFFGVVSVITLVVFGWAVIARQQPRPRRHHHHSTPSTATKEKAENGEVSSPRRHKHRRKQHRPVNPTLAETRGLPEARDDQTPPKSQL